MILSVAMGNTIVETFEKHLAIARFLDETPSDIDADYDDCTYTSGRAEYKVYTDEEADAACRDSIEDSLWAFNADFLASETGIDRIVFERLSDLCEGANDAVRSIIDATCGYDDFVKAAVSADGRGHFIATYDGDENDCDGFYIYRVN